KRQPVLFETLAFFMRVDPVAGRAQGKAAFDQSRDEDCAKAKPARVGGFQNSQTRSISSADCLRLRNQAAARFTDESVQLYRACVLRVQGLRQYDALNRCRKRAPQHLQAVEVEHRLREIFISKRSSEWTSNLFAKA